MTAKICPIEKKRRKNERARQVYKNAKAVKHILSDNLGEICKEPYESVLDYLDRKKERERVNSLNYRRRRKFSEVIDSFEWDDLVCLD